MPFAAVLRSRFRGRFSIQSLFILALLPGLIVGLVLAASYIADKRADLEIGARQTTRAVAQAVDKDLEGISNSLAVLSTSLYLRSGDFKAFHGRATEVANSQPLVDVIALVRHDGVQIVNSKRPWGTPLPMTGIPDLVRQTLSSGEVQYSDLFIGSVTELPYVAVQAPVEVQGVKYALTMAVSAERLSRTLAGLRLPEGWTCVIIDKNGKVVARSKEHSAWVGKQVPSESLDRMLASDNEGTVEMPDLDGVRTLTAFRRTTTSGWIVALGVPESVLYQDLPKSLALVGILLGISLVAGVLLALRFSSAVGKTLESLETATKLAAAGAIDVAAPVKGPAEMARLALQFNELQAARREIQARQEQVERALRLYNESNTILLFAEDERALLDDICRVVVKEGGYMMAWIGFALSDETKLVRPLAAFGRGKDYLQNCQISWADSEPGNGPTGLAIRTGRTQVVQNILTDPSMAPWQDAARRRGYQSAVALPLIVEKQTIGALNIFAGKPDAFAEEELSRLEKLASSLCFGIERLRTRTQLAIANEELQGFTYAASHDMKSPLQRIATFAGMLENSLGERLSDNERTMIGFIKENASRIITLVDDLLDHAQIEHLALQTQSIPIREAVQAIVSEKHSEIEAAGAVLSCDLPDRAVLANPLALSQVLRNLLSNALKYSSQRTPPMIRISGEDDGYRFRLAVQDNGVGFEMTYRNTIFELFRRLHSYAEFSGNGVGLALVKKAMERMGGRVWAESVPGKGATFFIELPIAATSSAVHRALP